MSLTISQRKKADLSVDSFLKAQAEKQKKLKTGLKIMTLGTDWLQMLPKKVFNPTALQKQSLKNANKNIKNIKSPLITFTFVNSLYKFLQKGKHLGHALSKRRYADNTKKSKSFFSTFQSTVISGLKVTKKGISLLEWLDKIQLIDLAKHGATIPLVLEGVSCATDLIVKGTGLVQTLDKVCKEQKVKDLSEVKMKKINEDRKILCMQVGRSLAVVVLATCAAVSFFFGYWIPPLVLVSLGTIVLTLKLFQKFAEKNYAHNSSGDFLLQKNLSRIKNPSFQIA